MNETTRSILHIDLDAFFCAVEEQHNPDLRGKAFAVGGRPDQRGVVASCSYPARLYGLRSAMPMAQALRLCPDLIIVSHSRGRYSEVSKKVMTSLRQVTPLVEPISIDEAFLDVSGYPDDGETIARRLQSQINQQFKLPVSIGVATNKLVAKIANNIGKGRVKTGRPPNAITVIPAGEEAAFLAPLPTRELWGVGPKTAESLAKRGIHTIGDIAACSVEQLNQRLGKHGADLWRRAQGIDTRPVETEHEAKSLSHETTFAQDVQDEQVLKRTLRRLSDGVGRRLRKRDLQVTTIKIKLRWSDFTTLTRQTTLDAATDQDDVIYQAAANLLEAHWPSGRPVRLIGVGVSGFDHSGQQLGLWDSDDVQSKRRLLSTLDEVKDRFGDSAIQRASDLTTRRYEE
ncbi:MAG: DNA polymerase IV [Chloroflexi bacterium]|nr:DNA polymerase IV [Chloroflexota bacterium]